MLQQGQVSFKILCKLALLFSLMAGLEKRSHKNHHEEQMGFSSSLTKKSEADLQFAKYSFIVGL